MLPENCWASFGNQTWQWEIPWFFFLDMEFHSWNQEHWDGQDESQFWHIFVVPKMYPILEPSEEVQDEMGSQPVPALVLGL